MSIFAKNYARKECNMKKKHIDNSRKEAYQQLCETTDLYIFMQHWWLEGVSAGKDWDVVLVHDENDPNRIIGALPYEIKKRLWISTVCQPEMTPYEGFWVAPELREDPQALEYIFTSVNTQLAERNIHSFKHTLPVTSPFPQTFQKGGFQLIKRNTYILRDTSDTEKIIDGFSRNKRKKLKAVMDQYTVCDLDPEEYYRFHVITCNQKRTNIWYTRELLLVIWEKAQQRGQARIIGIRNNQGELLAAALLVWDNKTLYQLVNTFDHDAPDNGARELLTLEVIKQAGSLHLQLDFVHHRDYLKHYGAQKCTYYSVINGSKLGIFIEKISIWFSNKGYR